MARKGWFGRRRSGGGMEDVPEGIATKCDKCSAILFAREFERNLKVCNKCGHHHRLNVRERLDITVDPDTFEEMDAHLSSRDPLAKTCAGVAQLDKARLPFISIPTDPATGGVFASYAAVGDIVLAEPGAIVGFAGRRVGNQDVGAKLPDNFQTSEFQFEH